MKTGLTPKEKINLAHDYIYDEHPIGLPYLSQWEVKESLKIPTACTNGKHLTYNPDWIGSLPSDVVKAIVLHEVAHVLFGHQLRCGSRDRRLWNIAADLEINGHLIPWYDTLDVTHELREDGLAGGVFPLYGRYISMDDGKAAEWYYNKLVKEITEQPDPEGDEGEGEGEGDKDGGSGEGSGSGDPPSHIVEDPASTEEADTDPAPAEGSDKGEGRGNNAEESFQRKVKEFLGEDYDNPGLGQVEAAPDVGDDKIAAEEEWKEMVSDAIVLQKEQGGGFGQHLDILDQLINKRCNNNWQVLRDWVSKRSLGGYTYKRFSRRHGWRKDILLPNNKTKNQTRGVMILDTSGSMGRDECDEAVRQMDKICREYRKAEITLIQCDTRVIDQHIKQFRATDFPLKIPEKWYGRGGTHMYPAINWVSQRANEFDWCILVSDMYWEVMYSPDEIPHTKIPTVYLGVNTDPDANLKPPHPQTHYLAVEV